MSYETVRFSKTMQVPVTEEMYAKLVEIAVERNSKLTQVVRDMITDGLLEVERNKS